MPALWRQIEADFQRDYGINLAADLAHMSWRRFSVLLMGLSPDGAVARDYGRVARRACADDGRGFVEEMLRGSAPR